MWILLAGNQHSRLAHPSLLKLLQFGGKEDFRVVKAFCLDKDQSECMPAPAAQTGSCQGSPLTPSGLQGLQPMPGAGAYSMTVTGQGAGEVEGLHSGKDLPALHLAHFSKSTHEAEADTRRCASGKAAS